MEKPLMDILWVTVSSGLVLLMQAGFLCLETGLTRSKNNINVAIKNLSDLGVSIGLFWAVGYGLMFGVSQGGWIGSTGFVPDLGAKVYRAATQADGEMVHSLVGEIEGEHEAVASALRNLADTFRFDEIMALTEPEED